MLAFAILIIVPRVIHAQDDSSDDGDTSSAAVDSSDSGDGTATAAADDGSGAGGSAEGGSPVTIERAPSGQALITMNFQNVDIPVLAKFISEITGKNFVIDESVRGKVSIISPTKVTPEQAYSIFQSVLQVKGYTTVSAGAVIKIVPARQVRESAALTESQRPGLQGDEYVTRMVKLRNIDAGSLVSVIQPMISHDGLVAAFPEDNTLIITDDAYNVERLLKIIGSLDIQGVQQSIEVLPLKLAFAGQIAPEIEQIMGSRGGGKDGYLRRPGFGVVAPSAESPGTNFKVIPDERTNSLIVLAGPLQMKQIKQIVKQLDIRPPNETAKVHVYHLKNADGLEMVQVLGGLLGGGGAGQLSPQTGRDSLGRGSSLGMFNSSSFGSGFGGASGGYGGMGGGFGSMGGSMGGGMGGIGGIGGGSPLSMMRSGSASNIGTATVSSGPTGSSSTEKMSGVFEEPVSITADPATNSLVISASPQDYETLKKIIGELDIPRVQVFVQAIIVEVSTNHARDIGVQFSSATNISNSVIGLGQLNFGSLQTALGNPLGLSGLGIGLASGSQCNVPVSGASSSSGTTVTTVKVPCDVALLTALEQDTHSNVLSAPTLLTADNEEAMIVIGQNLPFVSGSSANSALSGAIFNSVDRQNVGITLDIVPQVSEGDYVKLDMYEEVSNVVAGTTNVVTNPNGPTTTIRSASTTVLVMDHRTAVIGGLLANDTENSVQGVPFISDIPVIGNLFSDRSRATAKTNLLVFLTPHIIRTRQDLRALSLAERQDMIKRLGPKEMHDMPTVQIRSLSKPSFSIAVPPSATLPPPYNSDGTNSVTIPGPAAPPPPGPGASAGYGTSAGYSTSTTYSTGVTGGALSSYSSRTTSGYAPSAYSGPGGATTTTGPGAYRTTGGAPAATPLDAGAGSVGAPGAAH